VRRVEREIVRREFVTDAHPQLIADKISWARAFVLVIKRLLVADVGEVTTDGRAKPIHDSLGARDAGRAMPVARTKDLALSG
jgi:hypothetical protein